MQTDECWQPLLSPLTASPDHRQTGFFPACMTAAPSRIFHISRENVQKFSLFHPAVDFFFVLTWASKLVRAILALDFCSST
jgi:hypothetical protein